MVGAVGMAAVAMPVVVLVVRVPWASLGEVVSDPSVRTALWLSLRTSLVTLVLCWFAGLPVAWMLAHVRFPGRTLVRAVCVMPMVLPPVVGGVALLNVFGRRGVIGGPLEDALGVGIAFTQTATVLAQFFVAVPFFIVVMESAFLQVDPLIPQVARSLGARPWYVLGRVTVPMVMPSFVAASVLTWARALGEFGATITFAGNTPGRTQTLPLAIYSSLEANDDAAMVLSALLIGVSLVVLVSMRSRWLSGVTRAGGYS